MRRPLALSFAILAVLAAGSLTACGSSDDGGGNPAETFVVGATYDDVGSGTGVVRSATCTNSEGNRYECSVTLAAKYGFKKPTTVAEGRTEVVCDGKTCQESGDGLTITKRLNTQTGEECPDPAPLDEPGCVYWYEG